MLGQPVDVAGVYDSLSPVAPWRVVNIAGGNPVGLLSFVEKIEHKLGRQAKKNILPMQQGDVEETFANPALLVALTGFCPQISLETGVSAFVEWYEQYTNHH